MIHVHHQVTMRVDCHDAAQVQKSVEILSRVLARLALDGLEAHLNVWMMEVEDEGEDTNVGP